MNKLIKQAIQDLTDIDRYLSIKNDKQTRLLTEDMMPTSPDDVIRVRDLKKKYVCNAVLICGSISSASEKLGMNRKTVSAIFSNRFKDGVINGK